MGRRGECVVIESDNSDEFGENEELTKGGKEGGGGGQGRGKKRERKTSASSVPPILFGTYKIKDQRVL